MTNFTHLSSLNVQGSVETSAQGKLIGSFDTMPAANSQNAGQIVLYTGTTGTYVQGKYYVSNGSSWVLSAASPGSITIDSALSSTSTNPVQNKVIQAALNGKLGKTETAAKATADADGNTISTTYLKQTDAANAYATKSEVSSGYATKTELTNGLAGKQNTLTLDSTPTSGSSNPVTSGGVYSAINTKQDLITVSSSEPTSSDGSDGDLWAVYE